jgi:uncharacterized protein YxeA
MLSCTIDGYYRVNAYGKNQLWHRLVYKHFKGTTPKYIDHKNNNRIDNRIENLQEIERYNNTIKSKIRKTNKSGMPGVHWSKERECWKSCINSQGKKIGVRFFTDKIMAFKHYIDLRIKHHGKDTIEPIKEIIIKELGFDYYSNLAV